LSVAVGAMKVPLPWLVASEATAVVVPRTGPSIALQERRKSRKRVEERVEERGREREREGEREKEWKREREREREREPEGKWRGRGAVGEQFNFRFHRLSSSGVILLLRTTYML
jgi:hypothetical protein